MNCPNCGAPISASDAARALAKKCTDHSHAGRKRSRKLRCYCGMTTMHTAKARCFDCCKKSGAFWTILKTNVK